MKPELCALLIVAGCAVTDPRARETAMLADAAARAHVACVAATGLPGGQIVETCVKGLAVGYFHQAVNEEWSQASGVTWGGGVVPYVAAPMPVVETMMPPAMPAPTPVGNLGAMYLPRAAEPGVRYVPIGVGDPLNAGLNASGYPVR